MSYLVVELVIFDAIGFLASPSSSLFDFQFLVTLSCAPSYLAPTMTGPHSYDQQSDGPDVYFGTSPLALEQLQEVLGTSRRV